MRRCLAVLLGVLGVFLYLPFYLSFSSQAGGLAPSLSFFTRGIHFWVMFGTLLIPVLLWLTVSWRRQEGRRVLWRGLGLATALIFSLWLLSYAAGGVMLAMPRTAGELIGLQGGVDAGMILPASMARRLIYPGMWLSLLGILTLIIGQVLVHVNNAPGAQDAPAEALLDDGRQSADAVRGFILLMVLLGCGLVLFPEFFYLRDQFGWRMNTIFKFYYQAWILFALAAAYALSWLWQHQAGKLAAFPATAIAATIVLFVSMFFSAFGIQERLFPVGIENRV